MCRVKISLTKILLPHLAQPKLGTTEDHLILSTVSEGYATVFAYLFLFRRDLLTHMKKVHLNRDRGGSGEADGGQQEQPEERLQRRLEQQQQWHQQLDCV